MIKEILMDNEKNTEQTVMDDEKNTEQTATDNEKNVEQPVKVSSKRIKKTQRREAKAARKAANKIEEKRTTPNNGLIALLIFGVVVGMFAFVLGYNYFSKPATIEKYLEKNGGEEAYGSMQIDEITTAAITAKGNSMNVVMTVDGSDETITGIAKEFYSGENGEKELKNYAAYFITGIKPQTRAFSADVKATIKVGDEELKTVEMTYKEAKQYLEDAQKQAEEDAEAEEESSDEAAEEDAEAAEEPTDETAEDTGAGTEETEESADGE